MTPRSFFTILIKLIGIYLVYQGLLICPQLIATLSMVGSYREVDLLMVFKVVGTIVLAISVFLAILYSCFFRTESIIDLFRLDKGFSEERFELNIHRSTVLTIAVILIGAVTFIDGFPNLCRDVFTFVQMKHATLMDDANGGMMIFNFVETMIGLFLMTCSRFTVNFIERQRKR